MNTHTYIYIYIYILYLEMNAFDTNNVINTE